MLRTSPSASAPSGGFPSLYWNQFSNYNFQESYSRTRLGHNGHPVTNSWGLLVSLLPGKGHGDPPGKISAALAAVEGRKDTSCIRNCGEGFLLSRFLLANPFALNEFMVIRKESLSEGL